jgi:ssDNA-binding Zn-finger/Zn-ribbon topoisomerase 1
VPKHRPITPKHLLILAALSLAAGASYALLNHLGAAHQHYYFPASTPKPTRGTLITAAIINSAFFFLLALLAFRGIRALQDQKRRLAHRCPHCNYNLQALPLNSPCPECGN